MDFVFTVCDNAAGEACPIWPGQPMTAHWGIEDPAAVEGSDIEKQRAFNLAFRYLKTAFRCFWRRRSTRLDKLTPLRNRRGLREIGDRPKAQTRAAHEGRLHMSEATTTHPTA